MDRTVRPFTLTITLAALTGLPLASATASSANSPSSAIGAISRSTGHLFREGLAAGITADTNRARAEIQANENGLLSTTEQGSLGPELWKGLTPQDLAKMMPLLAPNPDWPSLPPLARRLLLTDAPWPSTDDMEAIRLERMVAFGAVIEAAHLYTHIAPETPSQRLRITGAQALWQAGDTNLACLEIKGSEGASSKDIPADMAAGCQNMGAAIVKPLPVWLDESLPYPERLKAFGASISLTPPAPPADFNPSPVPGDLWHTVARLYAEQGRGGTKTQAVARAHSILSLFPDLPWSIRTLFVPTFLMISTDSSFSMAEQRQIAATLLAVDDQAAGVWLKRVRAGLPTPLITDVSASSLFLLGKMRALPEAGGPVPLRFSDILATGDIKLLKKFELLSELLDTRPDFIDNPNGIYEKKNRLTPGSNYVIPVSVLRHHLVDGAQQGQVGRVVLASLLLLQTQPPETVDPDVLADILQSMLAVGLNEEARQIATSVFLGVTLLGEEKNGTSRSSGTTETKSTPVD